jgi:hypothetical protein
MNKKKRIALIIAASIIALIIIGIGFYTNLFYKENKTKTSNKLFPMVLENNKWTYMDSNGNVAIKAQFDYAGPFSEGLAAVKAKGKYGYIDKKGNFIIKPQFDDGFEFKYGRAAVCEGTSYGFIDKRGKMVIKPQYNYVRNFSDGLAYVVLYKKHIGNQVMFIDRYGKVKINTTGKKYKCDNLGADFSQGLLPVKFGYMYGFINKKEQVVIKPDYEGAQNFSEDLAAVNIMGKWGFINKNGKVVIKPKYDRAGNFSDGLAIVYSNNDNDEDKLAGLKYSLNKIFGFETFRLYPMQFINKKGITMFIKNGAEVVYPCISYIKFSNGLCRFDLALDYMNETKTYKGGIEYMNKKGKVVFERKNIYPVDNRIFDNN